MERASRRPPRSCDRAVRGVFRVQHSRKSRPGRGRSPPGGSGAFGRPLIPRASMLAAGSLGRESGGAVALPILPTVARCGHTDPRGASPRAASRLACAHCHSASLAHNTAHCLPALHAWRGRVGRQLWAVTAVTAPSTWRLGEGARRPTSPHFQMRICSGILSRLRSLPHGGIFRYIFESGCGFWHESPQMRSGRGAGFWPRGPRFEFGRGQPTPMDRGESRRGGPTGHQRQRKTRGARCR